MFVLRQGIRREHVLLVAAICAASDAVLIVVGVSGVGAATAALPWLVPAVRWAGALFLLGYGLLAGRRAMIPPGEVLAADAVEPEATTGAPASSSSLGATATLVMAQPVATAASVALTCLALTWLNPHVYLDTVFLLGSVAGTQGDRRWEFAVGAMLASVAWFFSLAYGGRLLGRWLATVRAWQVLDGIIAIVMIGLAVSLVA